MKYLLPFLMVYVMASLPARAQEGPADAKKGETVSSSASSSPAGQDVPARRLALAQRMHEIWPLRTRVEAGLDAVADQYPEADRAKIKAAMRRTIQYDALQEESIKAMAEIFTEEELQAMIDFYGSDVGRSVSAKTSSYELAMRPIVVKMIDKALLDLRLGQPQ